MNVLIVWIVLSFLSVGCCEILSVTTVATVSAIGAYYFFEKMGICLYGECCNNYWIGHNIHRINEEFNKHLIGHEYVTNHLFRAILGHFSDPNPIKPLVLSLHGPTGVGKNHAVNLIIQNMFRSGSNSKFLLLFIGPKNFPITGDLESQKIELVNSVKNLIRSCERSLIVFDEIDKIPSGLIDSLKPFLDHHHRVDNINFRHAIFVFIANSGQEIISQIAIENFRAGNPREKIPYKHLEKSLRSYLYNHKEDPTTTTGLWKSELLSSSLIDLFLPFLPLERHHVEKCIAIAAKNSNITNIDSCVQDVIEKVSFVPESLPTFSLVGCKKIKTLVQTFC